MSSASAPSVEQEDRVFHSSVSTQTLVENLPGESDAGPTTCVDQNLMPGDLEYDLMGYLRFRLHGVPRTEYTAQSLDQAAATWLMEKENKDRLGPYKTWKWRSVLITRCVNAVLPPGLEETGLIATYREHGARIRQHNRDLKAMDDSREDFRYLVGAAGLAAGAAAMVGRIAGHQTIAKGLGIVGAAGIAIYAASKARDLWRRASVGRWY